MTPPDEQDPQETPDELAARRAAQEQREQSADFDATDPPANPEGKSLEDMEADGTTEEDDGQMALVVGQEGGKEVTLGTLVKRGTPVEVKYKMTGKAVDSSVGGLLPFADPDILLLVPARAGKVEVDPTYGRNDEGEEVVKKVTLRPHIRPTGVLNARTPQARSVLFGDGTAISQLVATARAEGKTDDDIREIVENELSEALAA